MTGYNVMCWNLFQISTNERILKKFIEKFRKFGNFQLVHYPQVEFIFVEDKIPKYVKYFI